MGACCGKLPSSEEFLEKFEASPAKCLGQPSSDVILLAMQQKFLSLSSQDFSVKDNKGNIIAILDGKNLSLRDRAVLMNANREPIACLLEKIFSGSITFFVYAYKPYFDGQKPCGEKQNGQELYAWAKIWKKLLSITDEFHICMATGDNEYEAAEPGTYEGKAPGKLSSKLMVTKNGKGCCLIDREELQWGDLIGTNSYAVSIAAGIDPVLMIALTAIKDRSEEQGGG
mmetsp:Transcript_63823/g.106132  ORF Transcript_63823/g.106132 Transcript_63823/m.106132 type:complete len:228 (+) Transcript_63823:56-739(+)|eukprot:CAMPEP_0119312868 /NCGR_PEP_ID=MMETSP1333-20130426/27060_1 /TAXON_ID=418940 /ORGANISM="Scyphosphaera apsteinii, Strain RCC1455" /LENGTH=227 /DNA_ID=CAMNT_0007317549 /DNA_START=46 /DNA_END=729 /DNA_ORIENTATION=-